MRDQHEGEDIDLGLVQSDLTQKVQKENNCCYQFRRLMRDANVWIIIILILANIQTVLCFAVFYPFKLIMRLRMIAVFLCFVGMISVLLRMLKYASQEVHENTRLLMNIAYVTAGASMLFLLTILLLTELSVENSDGKINVQNLD